MFALIENETVTALVEAVPPPPEPLPEGYAAPDYREVIDGTKPTASHVFASVVEKPMSQWTLTPTNAVREWAEYVPPLSDCRAIAAARKAIVHKTATDSGIVVSGHTLPADTETLTKFIGKYVLLDALVRKGAITLTTPTSISDKNGDDVTLPVQDMLNLLLAYGVAYETRDSARRAASAQIKSATNITQLTSLA